MITHFGHFIAAIAVLFTSAAAAQTPAAAQPAEQQRTPPLAVEAFAQLPFISSAQLSPDGTRVAARVASNGNERIAVWALADPRDRPPRLIPAAGVESFVWAGDQRLLVNVATVVVINFGRGLLFPVPVRRVLVHDLQSNKTSSVTGSQGLADEVIFVDPFGRYALVSMQSEVDRPPSVHRVDLATGASVEIQPGRSGVWDWFADENGVVRVGVDYGERRTRIYYRATPDAELRLVESRRNLADDSVVETVRFVSNTDRGFIVTNAATGRFGLYEYDFAADARGAALFEHAEVDVGSAIFAPDGSPRGVVYEEDRPRVRWFDAAMGRLQQRVDTAFAGKTNTILN
ncbi:MAG: hypothetical protein M3177_06795, partial [Pseudomonadota bacterium]|nr:hypothetical protein [Pseudomonadota bacterium]